MMRKGFYWGRRSGGGVGLQEGCHQGDVRDCCPDNLEGRSELDWSPKEYVIIFYFSECGEIGLEKGHIYSSVVLRSTNDEQ